MPAQSPSPVGPALIPHSPDGLNAGPAPLHLAESLVTPTDRLFTRTHAEIPTVNVADWRLHVEGLVGAPLELSLDALTSRFPAAERTATLVCAGIRRSEFLAIGPLPGELPWELDACGTGVWSGVPLAAVLAAAGVTGGARHVRFTGLDTVERQGQRFAFGGSIPLERALKDDVLLATHLNGEPLSPAHGFPVRVVVPGTIGARCVKWLTRIELSPEPSDNYFQTQAYRVQKTIDARAPRDVSGGTAIQEYPLNSAILVPAPGSTVAAGPLTLRGWALGTGGSRVTRVEVSEDDGTSWRDAEVVNAGAGAWALWSAEVSVSAGECSFIVRASDETGATQPEHVADAWNVKGYCNNAWHRVAITAR